MTYQPARKILNTDPDLDEAWQQRLITDNPGVLGLPGDPTFNAAKRFRRARDGRDNSTEAA
jgi:hypothetical protein